MSKRFQTGVVIGKFLPPHSGHHFLIERALQEATEVTIIVCHRVGEDPIPGALRKFWLQEVHPEANVMVVEDTYDPDDSKLWAQLTIQWLGRKPDAVFTSEDYGHRYAEFLECEHVLVDEERSTYPCSGTAIRDDPLGYWQFLKPPVRAWFAKRVCIVGAESTGTTTLAKDLAEALDTVWLPEYGREYSEIKLRGGETEWSSDEFIHIAREQSRREDEAARKANKYLICDTNAFATCLWHRRYMGHDLQELEEISATQRADLYLLTGDEIPFVQDGLRDGESIRHEMHQWFMDALNQQTVPWQLISGDPGQRVQIAQKVIKKLFENS